MKLDVTLGIAKAATEAKANAAPDDPRGRGPNAKRGARGKPPSASLEAPGPAESPDPPDTSLAAEIAALDRMSMPELAARHAEVLGKPPRVRCRAFMIRRIGWRLQEQRSGGLCAAARERLERLISEIRIPDRPPNRVAVARLVRRGKKHATASKETPTSAAPATPAAAARKRRPGLPRPGTVIARQWRGRVLRLTVLDDGFELDGVVHKSLSAAAQAVTGAKWNGPLFWGLHSKGPDR